MAVLSDQERQEIFLQVCDSMRDYTAPCMAAVYGIVSNISGRLVGSGTFLRFRNAAYLLTAAHVAARMLDHETLAHTSSYGSRPELIRNPLVCQELPLDVALVRIENDVVSSHNIQSWPATVLSDDAENAERDILFVHGFSGERSHWLPIVNGGIHSESLPFGGSDATTVWHGYDPSLHVCISYPDHGWFNRDGREISMPAPEGLSGSAVWQTFRRHSPTGWNPTMARIIGVIHRHDPVAQCLIATRIEPIRDFLLQVLRREFAYFNWLERGQPGNDDLNDWYQATQRIVAIV